MSNLWFPDGSPRWHPAESAIQAEALNSVESTSDQESKFLAVCEWEKLAIDDLEISLVMARDLAATKTKPHQQASVHNFLDQIGAIEVWWRTSINKRAKELLDSRPNLRNPEDDTL